MEPDPLHGVAQECGTSKTCQRLLVEYCPAAVIAACVKEFPV